MDYNYQQVFIAGQMINCRRCMSGSYLLPKQLASFIYWFIMPRCCRGQYLSKMGMHWSIGLCLPLFISFGLSKLQKGHFNFNVQNLRGEINHQARRVWKRENMKTCHNLQHTERTMVAGSKPNTDTHTTNLKLNNSAKQEANFQFWAHHSDHSDRQ